MIGYITILTNIHCPSQFAIAQNLIKILTNFQFSKKSGCTIQILLIIYQIALKVHMQHRVTVSDIVTHLQSLNFMGNPEPYFKDTEKHHLELWKAAVHLAKDCTGTTDNDLRFIGPLESTLFSYEQDDEAIYYINANKLLTELARKLRIRYSSSIFTQSENRQRIIQLFATFVRYSRYRKNQLAKVESRYTQIKTLEEDLIHDSKELEKKTRKYNDLKAKKAAEKPVCDELISAKKDVETQIDYRNKEKLDLLSVKQQNQHVLEESKAEIQRIDKQTKESQLRVKTLQQEIVRNVPEIKQNLVAIEKQYQILSENLLKLEDLRKAKLQKADQVINKLSMGTADVFEKATSLLNLAKQYQEYYMSLEASSATVQQKEAQLKQLLEKNESLIQHQNELTNSMRMEASEMIKASVEEYSRKLAYKDKMEKSLIEKQGQNAELRKLIEHCQQSLRELESNIDQAVQRYAKKIDQLKETVETLVASVEKQLNLMEPTDREGSKSRLLLAVFDK